MADTELHIIIKEAGDVGQLNDLLNAAMAMNTKPVQERVVVPNGYRCVECYSDDGKHTPTCSLSGRAAT